MEEKILIIDREPDIQRAVGTILTRKGFLHKSAGNFQEGLDLIRSEHFDLIIMEIRISMMNGFDFLADVKKLSRHIEIIVLTGSVSIGNAIQALRHNGAFDFLTKPLEKEDQLINSVEKAIEKQKLNRITE